MELYDNATSEISDVVFTVGERECHAHTLILSMKAKILFELSKEYKNDVPIRIHEVSEIVFGSLLDYVYSVKAPDIENENIAMELLVAADRFDCTQLKLYAESVIADKFLVASNAAELLVFADSYSCALLKEAAMNLYKTSTNAVRESQSWNKVKESYRLLGELLDHLYNPFPTSGKLGNGYSCDDVDHMDVASLHDQLQEAHLKVDGGGEIIVQRLKEHIS